MVRICIPPADDRVIVDFERATPMIALPETGYGLFLPAGAGASEEPPGKFQPGDETGARWRPRNL